MNETLLALYKEIKKRGLAGDRERKALMELNDHGSHEGPDSTIGPENLGEEARTFGPDNMYMYNDFSLMQSMTVERETHSAGVLTIDKLLERDKQREKDGFPRKIRLGRLIKPSKGGTDRIVVVPTTVEEKFIHDMTFKTSDEDLSGGSGEGEEGDVIGEQPVREEAGSGGSGQGEGEAHEMESSAYDLGKILSEQFELPNLKEKGKKRALARYTYDMTDRNRRFGQILDKKATLRKIVETNISLGNIPDIGDIDPSGFMISPDDKIYRVLSREIDYESQAMIFFLRDYSGSMSGKPTELIVSQHVLIYSWILYQYAKQVESRFILHDTEAHEVPDFYTYYNSKVAGGTKVASAFRLVNELVDKEGLARDYNIYVFHGTDGDDWDTDGKETVPEIKKTLTYANRVGITIAEHSIGQGSKTEVEKYITNSKLLDEKPDLLRLDVLQEDADEPRLIEGIKKLIS